MPSAPRLDNQVCFALYTASRLVTRAYRPLLDELGLTYAQYLALLVLWERRDQGEPPAAVKDLGQRLLLDSGTLTPLLKRLERQGLITRTRDEHDERTLRIALTPAGSALSERAAQVPAQLLCDSEPVLLEELAGLRDAAQGLIARLVDEERY